MRTVLAFLAVFLLACGGMLSVFIPDLPVVLPPDSRTFTGRVDESEGTSTTHVRGISESTDLPTVQRHLHDQLVSAGYSVQTTPTDDGVVLTAQGDGDTVVVTLDDRAGPRGCGFDVVWVQAIAPGEPNRR
ncbi:MAG: hypothetical protein R3F61_29430 [Myxococcota bacterium]